MCAALVRRGYDIVDATAWSYATSRVSATSLVESGAIDALVVVGGDGMVHLGLDVVATTGVPLGIAATGTGNDVARHLGLPARDIEASVSVIDAALRGGGQVFDADAIHATRPDGTPVAGEYEWSMAVVCAGMDAAVNARANAMRWPHEEGRYVRAALVELARMIPYGYRVRLEGAADVEGTSSWRSPGDGDAADVLTWQGAAILLAVANTRYIGGGMDLAPMADAQDGVLEVVRLDPLSRAGVARVFPSVFAGEHLSHPAVKVARARAVVVESWDGRSNGTGGVARTGSEAAASLPRRLRRPPLPFSDGEPLTDLPLRLEAVPQAVRLLLPRA